MPAPRGWRDGIVEAVQGSETDAVEAQASAVGAILVVIVLVLKA